jgi:hypothetical protein
MTKSSADKLRVDLSTRRITLVDGDKADEWSLTEVRKASRAYGRSWSLIFLDAARALAAAPMSPSTNRILWWCIAYLHPKDWTLVRHERIAAELDLTRSMVTKALGELRDRGLIQFGDHSAMRLTLFVGWQGTAQAYQKQKRGRAKEIEAGRKWHKDNGADGPADKLMRVSDDGEGTGPRERTRQSRRGGDARAVGDFMSEPARIRPQHQRGPRPVDDGQTDIEDAIARLGRSMGFDDEG